MQIVYFPHLNSFKTLDGMFVLCLTLILSPTRPSVHSFNPSVSTSYSLCVCVCVSMEHLFGIIIVERLTHIFKHQFRWFFTIHTSHQIVLLIMVNDWHGFRIENIEALFQRLDIIIRAASATAQATINANAIGTFEEQYKL